MRAVPDHSEPSINTTDLRLNYFVVDADDRLCRITAKTFERVWDGVIKSSEVLSDGEAVELGRQLRLVTVLSDCRWQPLVTFLMRTGFKEGRIMAADRYKLYRTLSGKCAGDVEATLVRYQLSGWPADWRQQLAVAIDTPAANFTKVSIGGPIVMADLWGLSVNSVMHQFEVTLK